MSSKLACSSSLSSVIWLCRFVAFLDVFIIEICSSVNVYSYPTSTDKSSMKIGWCWWSTSAIFVVVSTDCLCSIVLTLASSVIEFYWFSSPTEILSTLSLLSELGVIANNGTFVCLLNEGDCRFDILIISCLLMSFCIGVRLFDRIPFTVFLLSECP